MVMSMSVTPAGMHVSFSSDLRGCGYCPKTPWKHRPPPKTVDDKITFMPKKAGVDRWTPKEDELDQAVREFRKLLVHRYHSMVKAWRDLDREQLGRLSFFTFCRSCAEIGYDSKRRTLWHALDENGDGFISFYEFDHGLASLLGNLAMVIWATCGSIDAAWERHFNPKVFGRCSLEMFCRACEDLRFPGDAIKCFMELNVSRATTGITRKDLGFLELWFAKPKCPGPRNAMHEGALRESTARHGDSKQLTKSGSRNILRAHHGPQLSNKDYFKRLLTKSYGNFVRAWRKGLDFDKNGRLDQSEFNQACQDIGFAGDRVALWAELDENGSGEVSLGEIDHHTALTLESFIARVLHLHGSWDRCWDHIFDKRHDDRVDCKHFIDGCLVLGWGGNADRMFDLLNIEKLPYLSYDMVSWLTGGEAPEQSPLWEDIGEFRITGAFRKATKSQVRNLDMLNRENRVRRDKFLRRDAGMITDKPGGASDQVFGGGATTKAGCMLSPELKYGVHAVTSPKATWTPKTLGKECSYHFGDLNEENSDPLSPKSMRSEPLSPAHSMKSLNRKLTRSFSGYVRPLDLEEEQAILTSEALTHRQRAPLYPHDRFPLKWLGKPSPKRTDFSPKVPKVPRCLPAVLPDREPPAARLGRASLSEPSLVMWQSQATEPSDLMPWASEFFEGAEERPCTPPDFMVSEPSAVPMASEPSQVPMESVDEAGEATGAADFFMAEKPDEEEQALANAID